MSDGLYRFSTSLPYLLARLGMRMGELFARELAWEGLTLPMFRVLAVLTEAVEPQRLGDVSEQTSVEVSTMSRLLSEMQRRGLITRERPENNQRSLSIALTNKGTEVAARLIPRAAEYERVAMGDLSSRRAVQLKDELAQIYERLNDIEVEIVSMEKRMKSDDLQSLADSGGS